MNLQQILTDKTLFAPPIQRLKMRDATTEQLLEAVKVIGRTKIPDFSIDADNEFLYTNLAKWLIGDKTMKCHDVAGRVIDADLHKGLYIAGTTGTGKSVAIDIFGHLAKLLETPLILNGEGKFLSWKSYLCTEICDTYATSGELYDFINAESLCIQDLGAEIERGKEGEAKAETMYMGNRRNVLRTILEGRGDFLDKMTIITSNYKIDGKVITQAYGDRVISRLGFMCNYFILKGDDRRK